jgi:hypothetical protein
MLEPFLPTRVFPGNILGRLPVPPGVQELIKGATKTGITVSLEKGKPPSEACHEFYRNILADRHGFKQAVFPIVAEVVKIAEDCEETKFKKIKVGDYVGFRNFQIVSVAIDESEDDLQYFYFMFEPKNVHADYSKELGEQAFLLYGLNAAETFKETVKEVQATKQVSDAAKSILEQNMQDIASGKIDIKTVNLTQNHSATLGKGDSIRVL